MNARFYLSGATLACALALGCNEKSSSSASTTTEPTPAGATSAAIPTEEDYEQKAQTDITTSNAETELAKLEKEIGAPPK